MVPVPGLRIEAQQKNAPREPKSPLGGTQKCLQKDSGDPFFLFEHHLETLLDSRSAPNTKKWIIVESSYEKKQLGVDLAASGRSPK